MSEFKNILNFGLNYSTIGAFATDDRFFVATIPSLNQLSDLLGNTRTIKLKRIGFIISRFWFFPVVAGEDNERFVINYYSGVLQFFLKGSALLDPLSGQPIAPSFSEGIKYIDFGDGIIIDNITFPTSVISFKIGSSPPAAPSAPTGLTVNIVIEYNQNFNAIYNTKI